MDGITAENLQKRDLYTLYRAAVQMTRHEELPDALKAVVQEVDEKNEIEAVQITVREQNGDCITVSTSGEETPLLPSDSDVIERVLSTGSSFIIPGITKVENGSQNPETMPTLCAPLPGRNRTLGALCCLCTGQTEENQKSLLGFLITAAKELGSAVERELNFKATVSSLINQNRIYQKELFEKNSLGEMIGNSSAMQVIFDKIHRLIDSSAAVLIRGETGTGKHQAARTLHFNSSRREKPFISVSASSAPGIVVERRLFGQTPENIGEPCAFEEAEGGTLYIEDIECLESTAQERILASIQNHSWQSGSGQVRKSDIRIITSTAENLEKLVENANFREDLYYRLNVSSFIMPPLRERRSDIILIAESFLEKFNRRAHKHINRISTSAIDLLVQYHWPGNIRELKNCIRKAVNRCDGETIRSLHLPPSLQTSQESVKLNELSFTEAVENFEKELIIDGLKRNNGNQTRTAKELQTSLRIINYKIHQYNIEPKSYKL